MNIREVTIRNVMGIRDLKIADAGNVVHVTGPNGSGKTSLVKALRTALRGEMPPQILTVGENRGEVLVVLDDGSEIRREIGGRSPRRRQPMKI